MGFNAGVNPTPNNAPRWLKRLAESRHFVPVLTIAGGVICFAPLLIWKLPGALWPLGLIVGFIVGYWLARAEWRTRGFVPSLKRLDEINREPPPPSP